MIGISIRAVAERTSEEPPCNRARESEANGDEGVDEVPFRPRPPTGERQLAVQPRPAATTILGLARHSRKFWEKLVAEVQRGADVTVVAARHGVRPGTLGWWRWSLSRPRTATRSAPQLLPVVVERPTARREPRLIQIAVGASVVRLEEGTDVAYVAALVSALRSAC
jgi:hypothetical protein